MTYSVLQGIASNLSQETKVTGGNTSGGQYSANTVVNSHNEINLRIDNTPCLIRLKQTIHLEEGEPVTVIGENKKGVFNGYAIRNDVTKVVYLGSWKSMTIWCSIMLFIMAVVILNANWFFAIVYGVVALPFAWFILSVQKYRVSEKTLQSSPASN